MLRRGSLRFFAEAVFGQLDVASLGKVTKVMICPLTNRNQFTVGWKTGNKKDGMITLPRQMNIRKHLKSRQLSWDHYSLGKPWISINAERNWEKIKCQLFVVVVSHETVFCCCCSSKWVLLVSHETGSRFWIHNTWKVKSNLWNRLKLKIAMLHFLVPPV